MPAAGWLEEFQPFSIQHALVLAVTTAAMVAFIAIGRRWRSTPKEIAWRRMWGVSVIIAQIVTVAWWAMPANFDPAVSLPLHLCDLTVWIGAVALLSPSRLARNLAYFWGLGLSSQAFITPTLQQGAGQMEYWLFWIQHTQIVGIGFYVVLVDRFRPTLRDLGLVNIITIAYLGLMLAVNVPFGLNYGYVGNADPEHDTIIQRLGPWPLRIVWLSLIVEAVFVTLWVIWPIGLSRLAPLRREAAGPQ
ncbi:MAG: TIGR02206 family membrane protein [Phycisphaerales bacterium JB039]